jgi:4-hydroxy-tetrahydrodipicolinate synthase
MDRRKFLTGLAAASVAAAPSGKPMRGIFIILATPFTDTKAVDYADLAREAEFLAGCGVHGMVWPQIASEYSQLTVEERMRGMEVLAKAARAKRSALVFGIQGPNLEAALGYARRAEELEPDAVIAMPPAEAGSIEEVHRYYAALAGRVRRPCFVQTTGGPRSVPISAEFVIGLAREFPHLGYVKEEADPIIARVQKLAGARPAIQAVFTGNGGRNLLYEMRLGVDGNMPGAAWADIHAQIWDLYQAGRTDRARELFSKLLLMVRLDESIPGSRLYVMKKRGVFKAIQSRQRKVEFTPAQIEEIEFNFAALKPFLKV